MFLLSALETSPSSVVTDTIKRIDLNLQGIKSW